MDLLKLINGCQMHHRFKNISYILWTVHKNNAFASFIYSFTIQVFKACTFHFHFLSNLNKLVKTSVLRVLFTSFKTFLGFGL